MGIKERLIEYLKFKNIRKVHFEKSINVSNGYVNNIVKNIPHEKMTLIKNLYPCVPGSIPGETTTAKPLPQ